MIMKHRLVKSRRSRGRCKEEQWEQGESERKEEGKDMSGCIMYVYSKDTVI